MKLELVSIISELARRKRVELPPSWADKADDLEIGSEHSFRASLVEFTRAIGWREPSFSETEPGPEEFPVLVCCEIDGLAIAEQWEASGFLRVFQNGSSHIWPVSDKQLTYVDVTLPEIAGQKKYSRAISLFADALSKHRRTVFDAALATVVLNILGLGTSLYTMQVYDRVVPRGGFSTLWVLTVGVLIAVALDLILRIVRAVMLEKDAAVIDAGLSSFLFKRSQQVRLDARQGGIGSMAGQLRSYDQVRSLLSSASVFAIADLPFALFFIAVIYWLAGWIAIVPAAAFFIAIIAAFIFALLIRTKSDEVQIGSHKKNGMLVEALDAAETIKSTRGEWDMLARWNKLIEDVQSSDYDLKKLSAVATSFNSTLQQASYVLLIAFGAIRVVDGDITAGTLIAVSILNGRITGTLVSQLPTLIVQASYARSSLLALNKFLELPTDREETREYLRPPLIKNNIRFESIEFAYPGAPLGFQAPDLKISPGERIAVLGPVGSGKSTFLKILAGLIPAQRGQLLLDGLDLGLIAEDRLRSHVGYLGQDFRIVNGTLRQQLTMGLSDPGDQAIIEAASQTGLNDLISRHPKGLDLVIQEGGKGLSGGQRMLVGLTRTLIAKPKLWLLDEPTAALDPEVEKRVWRAITNQLQPEDTLVFVTHKFQLLQLAERVIVVSQGKVSLDGPTQAVLDKFRLGGAGISEKGVAA